MKKAYIVGHITIKNKERWEDYRSRVPDTLEPYGAELIFRGKLNSILSGNHAHTDTVIISFHNSKDIDSWYSSPEYQSLIPLRQEAAEIDLLVFEE